MDSNEQRIFLIHKLDAFRVEGVFYAIGNCSAYTGSAKRISQSSFVRYVIVKIFEENAEMQYNKTKENAEMQKDKEIKFAELGKLVARQRIMINTLEWRIGCSDEKYMTD